MARLNLPENTYYWLKKHPKVQIIVRELTRLYFQDDIPDVLLALRNSALSGDAKSAETFLKYIDENYRIGTSDDPARTQAKFIPANQVNIIINNLEQKFYDDQSRQIDVVERKPTT